MYINLIIFFISHHINRRGGDDAMFRPIKFEDNEAWTSYVLFVMISIKYKRYSMNLKMSRIILLLQIM
jgi:hypothetical protein